MASAGRLLCCLFRKYIRATPAAVAVDRNTVSILMFHQKPNIKKKREEKSYRDPKMPINMQT